MYNIINHCDKNDLKYNIFPLLINNFYENIFSSKIIENQLIYIIIMLMNKEIKEIDSLTDKKNFLENEMINIFINELIKKVEIQKYFKIIVQDPVNEVNLKTNEYYLNNYNNDYILNNKINLDVINIEELITQRLNQIEKKKEREIKYKKSKYKKKFENISSIIGNEKEGEKNNTNKGNNEEDSTIKKYFNDITKSVLKNKASSKETDKNIKEYCLSQIKIMNYFNQDNNMEIYSNQTILKNIYRSSISSKIFNVYQNFFAIIIDTINHLLKNIIDNITIMPISLKIICKCIVILAKKKFGNNFTYIDSVYFFGKFFFNKLLIPFFKLPLENCLLISSLHFSEETYYNLEIISIIFNKFYSGNLFFQSENGGNLTPFNGFFLDKMSELYKIFDDIMSINLPSNIKNLINCEDIEEYKYEYDYFKEYKNEILYHQSCCISFNDLLVILKTVYNNKYLIINNNISSDEHFKNLYEKIINNKNYLNYILEKSLRNVELSNLIFYNKDNKANEKKDIYSLSKNNLEYFIINRVSYNKNCSKKIKYITSDFSYMNLNKNENEDENVNDNELFLIRIKNGLCEILSNIPYLDYMINNNHIKSSSLNNFISFLSDIKLYQNYLIKHKTINQIKSLWPFEFSTNFLLNNISSIPNNYSENNYELFFKEIKEEINKSIKLLEFDTLSQFYNNFSNYEQKQEVFQIYLLKLAKIPLNKRIQKIIDQIPVFLKIKVTYNNNQNNNIFENILIEIKRSITNSKKMKNTDNIYIDAKRNLIVYKTIEIFARNFSFENNINYLLPEYLSHYSSENKDIFNYISKFNFSTRLIEFFNKDLRLSLSEQNCFDNLDRNNISKVISKLYDYLMNYLYDPIYKYLPSQQDKELSIKINKLSWTKLNNFVVVNANLYECEIQRIVDCFNNLENTKIPSEKYFCFKEIIEISKNIPCHEKINYLNKKLGKEILLNPIILYGLIKSKPKKIISDIRYVNCFIQEKNTEIEDYFNTQLPSYISYIQELNHKNLYGNISEDEFTIKCNEITLNEDKKK